MLTSDPSWGEGEAVLAGSEQVTGWSRGGHPAMPDGDKVWHADIDFLPRAAWLVTPGTIRRLALARTAPIEEYFDAAWRWRARPIGRSRAGTTSTASGRHGSVSSKWSGMAKP